MKKLLLAILLSCISAAFFAQQNNTLFLMHELPQSNIVNPAVPIDCKLFVGFPLVGSTHVNAYSSGFALSDILVSSTDDSLKVDLDGALSKMDVREMIATEIHLSLLSVGYMYKDHYFTLGINEKVNTYSTLNRNAVLLVNGGNTPFEGQRTQMDGTRVNAIHYREYALGWAREWSESFSLGVRIKFLFGKSNIYTKPAQVSLYTDAISFDTYVAGSMEGNMSLPVDVNRDADGRLDNFVKRDEVALGDYLMNKENKGYGVDLGFIYQLNDKTTLSGSLLDLGYVNWKSDAYALSSAGSMDITGEAVEEGLGNLDAVIDSLAEVLNPEVADQAYSSPLVPTIYLGISRQMNSWLQTGAVLHTEFYRNSLHSSFSLTGNGRIASHVFGSLSYTIQNGQFNNVGAGIGAQWGFIHIHALSDNIPAFFNLMDARNVNLRVGISMLLGCGGEKKSYGNDKGIRALPCVGDPYSAIKSRKKRRRR
ncbi:DUF5723 family protein [Saccharicrinis fermentans]|uniref:DUF5723 domain-containing protein n=1 Tax=Saccharicrinis fermentans DSM 9555 = JCM 21142 TaxID=869213 RepID=W7YIV5_9BACT|nr:DUF5723 family protein [Saccharicrinis fermentans]GAF02464.1 hypothetical protein JCM21142_31099 [Saccharicrinis fermentans DSM 9555 = JCM 21142]